MVQLFLFAKTWTWVNLSWVMCGIIKKDKERKGGLAFVSRQELN
jgi:hypothetical protein